MQAYNPYAGYNPYLWQGLATAGVNQPNSNQPTGLQQTAHLTGNPTSTHQQANNLPQPNPMISGYQMSTYPAQ